MKLYDLIMKTQSDLDDKFAEFTLRLHHKKLKELCQKANKEDTIRLYEVEEAITETFGREYSKLGIFIPIRALLNHEGVSSSLFVLRTLIRILGKGNGLREGELIELISEGVKGIILENLYGIMNPVKK